MNKQETTKLLALIRIAYPTAYRDMDDASKKATVHMWAMSFPEVPYPIMEQAFNRFRMVSKFPPTVAEMVLELRRLYHKALEGAMFRDTLGDREGAARYRAIMEATELYKDDTHLGGPVLSGLPGGTGGNIMQGCLEHPEIGWIERTGYSSCAQETEEKNHEDLEDSLYEERRERQLFEGGW